MTSGARRAEVRARLAQSGFIAAGLEADSLIAAAGNDDEALAAALERRLRGEPLAWIVGRASFCGSSIRVTPGVYVPRAHSELLVHRTVARLPANGVAVDVCTGSGAIAAAVQRACPHARVVGCDVDAAAVACARINGIEVYEGDLLAPLPPDLRGRVDVLVGVVPYVPTAALPLLQRDTFAFEDRVAYDGGIDGLDVLRRAAGDATRVVRPGGAVVLELGGEQADLLAPDLHRLGFVDVATLVDDDGQARGIEATWSGGTIAR